MRELEQRAYCYLGRDPVLCMDMLESLRRGSAGVSAVREDGVLLLERSSGICLLAAKDCQAGEALTDGIARPSQIAVHDEKNAMQLRDHFHFTQVMECYSAAYLEPEARLVRESCRLEAMGMGDIGRALEAFGDEYGEEEMAGRIRAGQLLGAFRNRELVGMIGLYPEGSIGMLSVRPGEQETAGELLAGITAWCLEKCLAPYAHIPIEDEALVELYRQAGYTFAESNLFWLG